MLPGGFNKQILILRQTLADMASKNRGADIVEIIGVPVIFLIKPLKLTVVFDFFDKGGRRLQQAVVFIHRKRPGQLPGRADVKSIFQVKNVTLAEQKLVGIDDGVVNHFVRNHFQQLVAFQLAFIPVELGVGFFQFDQGVNMAGAGDHFQAAANQVFDRARPLVLGVVNQLLGNLHITGSKAKELLAVVSDGQPGGGEMAHPVFNAGEQLAEGIGCDNLQLDAEFIGKHADHVVFQPGRAIRAFIIGCGAVAGQHHQFAVFENLL